MKSIPIEYLPACESVGNVEKLTYRDKFLLLYTPTKPAKRILYLIHGGGGDQYAFFCPDFLNMVDHMIDGGELEPLYIVSPCFYDPKDTDKTPAASGVAVKRFIGELRDEVLPLTENHIGRPFTREERAIGGFSMGGVTTWYAFMEALDLFYWFLPLSGDCWVCGEKGGGEQTETTVRELIEAVARQGTLDYRVHAITGSNDIAFPNLDPQMKAMDAHPDVFGGRVLYDVMEGGVHDYETIFRYLYNTLPKIGAGETEEPWRAEKVELVRRYH